MSINKVEEMVESYINGNISDFKKWLKKASKKDILVSVQILASYYVANEGKNWQRGYELAVTTVFNYL